MVMTVDKLGIDARETGRGRWVVGVDGSECADNALHWAVANAPHRATGLELVTAWQVPVASGYPVGTPSLPYDEPELRAAVAADLASIADRVRADSTIPVETALGQGGAAEVLLAAAEGRDLLVIGSRGRGGFARLLLGSTSTQCATHATVPTVVVPGDAAPIPARRLLVGFDGSPNAMAALNWAIDYAAPGSTMVVAWVWDATPLAVGSDAFFFPDASDLAAERFHHLVEPVQERAVAAGVTLEREFIRGTPRAALAAHADEADLVVVGARGHGAVGAALLGSVSTWMLHHVHRPIAVIPFTDDEIAEPEPPPDVFRG